MTFEEFQRKEQKMMKESQRLQVIISTIPEAQLFVFYAPEEKASSNTGRPSLNKLQDIEE